MKYLYFVASPVSWQSQGWRFPSKGGVVNTLELARKLNGRQYGKEITRDEARTIKNAGFVVVFGYSDDNMEFRGAIHDEVGCYDGGMAYVSKDGLLVNDCDCDNCPNYKRVQSEAKTIEALWDVEGYSWKYKTDIPHSTFDILEGDELFCQGIVFSIDEV